MDLQGKNILVTGADGFIGSHLAETLVKLGANVRAFVYYNALGHWGWLEHIEKDVQDELDIYAGDIRSYDSVRESMSGCHIVFHLAALISTPYSYRSPVAFVDTNIKGSLNVVQAARELDIQKVIHASTSEVYGNAQYIPIDECHPLQGQSPCSASKIGADQLVMSFFNSFDTPVAIIRPFDTYGPRQSTRAVIPKIITQISDGIQTLKLDSIYATKDFSYIEDTVRGFISVAESDAAIGQVVNIGSGYEISVKNTALQIASLMKTEIEIISNEDKIPTIDSREDKKNEESGENTDSKIERLLSNNSKALEILDWSPHYAGTEGLKRGLQYTINWFTNPDNLRHYKPERHCV